MKTFFTCLFIVIASALKAQESQQIVQKLSAIQMVGVYQPQFADSIIYFQGKKYLVHQKEYYHLGKLTKLSVYKGIDYVEWTEPAILSAKDFQKAYSLSDTLVLHTITNKKVSVNGVTYLIKAKEAKLLYLAKRYETARLYILVCK